MSNCNFNTMECRNLGCATLGSKSSVAGASTLVYVAEHCYCCYESAFEVISVHKTLAGAYHAKQQHQWKTWMEERDFALRYGRSRLLGPQEYALFQLWRVRRFELKQ